MELSDEELMKLYQNGDEAAFKALYARHSSKVYGYLKKRIRDEQQLKDIYQEVFFKLHKSKHLYNANLPLLPWIFTVTRNVMIDVLRKEKVIEFIPEEAPVAPAGLEELAQLPERQRAAIEKRYIDDQTFAQIAQSLNVSESNVRQIVSRGIKRLRQLIEEGGKS